ncbi:HDOD domain-containing protein, partial [Shewanella sp. 202IG2-18]|uniref:HDOD domain-containing protein n=1 Tax=Parashewanella hymeniacidonis TaxID=2807618 RepID=UPI00195FCF3F
FWKRSLKTNLLLIFITRVGLPALASSLVFVTLDHIDLISPHYLFGKECGIERGDQLAVFIASQISDLLRSPTELLNDLPVLPSSLNEISRQLKNDEFDAISIVKLLNEEPVIAAKVIQLANSSAYKKGETPIISLKKAFLALGANGLNEAVINGFVKQLIPQNNLYFQFYGVKLWQHSVTTGKIAKNLLEQSGRKEFGAEAYLLGLMQNLGNIVIYQLLLDAFSVVPPECEPGSRHFKKVLNQYSKKLTHQIAYHWGFPERVVMSLEKQSLIHDRKVLEVVFQTDFLSGYIFEANVISQALLLKRQSKFQAKNVYEQAKQKLYSPEAIASLDSLFIELNTEVA